MYIHIPQLPCKFGPTNILFSGGKGKSNICNPFPDVYGYKVLVQCRNAICFCFGHFHNCPKQQLLLMIIIGQPWDFNKIIAHVCNRCCREVTCMYC